MCGHATHARMPVVGAPDYRSTIVHTDLAFEYRIFRTIRRTYTPLIFSKIKHAPYSTVRLMCGSGCALSASFEQIIFCNKRYQRNCTYLNSFFLKSKLVSFLRSNYLSSLSLRMCFISSPTFVPFTNVFFSSLYVRKSYVRRACIATCT